MEGFTVKTEPIVDDNEKIGELQELLLDEALPFHSGKYRCRGYSADDEVRVETEVTTSGEFCLFVFVLFTF